MSRGSISFSLPPSLEPFRCLLRSRRSARRLRPFRKDWSNCSVARFGQPVPNSRNPKLTQADAADLLGCSCASVHQMVKQGQSGVQLGSGHPIVAKGFVEGMTTAFEPVTRSEEYVDREAKAASTDVRLTRSCIYFIHTARRARDLDHGENQYYRLRISLEGEDRRIALGVVWV